MKNNLLLICFSLILISCDFWKAGSLDSEMSGGEDTVVVIEEKPQQAQDSISNEDNDLVFYTTELVELQKKAVDEKKIVMLFFSASWCNPCKVYKEETFLEQDNKAFLQANYFIKYLDVDTDYEGIELNAKYNVKNLPTLVFLNEKGEEFQRIVGHIAGYSFLKKITEIKALY